MDAKELDLAALREDAERYLAYGGDVPGGNVARFVLAMTDPTPVTAKEYSKWSIENRCGLVYTDGQVPHVRIGGKTFPVQTRGEMVRVTLARLRSGRTP